jgi:bifunctional DNA-binding transcriptional regulator/antitoxin component of YhaV-PrlF toxin-antitoxin module
MKGHAERRVPFGLDAWGIPYVAPSLAFIMDREYEATIESEGRLHLPREVQERYHLTRGSHVKIKEEGKHLVIAPIEIEDITDLAGILKGGDPVGDLLRERALDRAREDAKFRFR